MNIFILFLLSETFQLEETTLWVKFHLIFFPLLILMYNKISERENSNESYSLNVRLHECFMYRNLETCI